MGARRGKGEGSVYKDAQGRWVAAVPLPPDPATGRRRRKVFRTRSKVEALRKMRETQNELARTGNVSTNRPVTVAEWMEQWIDQDVAPIRKPATTADYRSLTRTHIVPAIGRCRIDRLSSSDIRTLHRYISQSGRSSSTAAKVHRVLRAALAAAEREGVAPRNVARLVKAPPTSSQPPRAMSAEEARRFLRARRSRGDHARWSLALMIGERQGEALGLQLDHLHLDDAMPWVDLAWELRRVTWEHGCGIKALGAWPCGYRRAGDCPDREAPVPSHMEAEQVHGGLWLLRPKTIGSQRRVALPQVLADSLAEHLETARPTRFVFESQPGVPVDPRRDHEDWKTALKEEGLPTMRLHSARHTAATLLLEAGVSLRTAQEILGQTQALTTARYQHPSLELQAASLEEIAGAIT